MRPSDNSHNAKANYHAVVPQLRDDDGSPDRRLVKDTSGSSDFNFQCIFAIGHCMSCGLDTNRFGRGQTIWRRFGICRPIGQSAFVVLQRANREIGVPRGGGIPLRPLCPPRPLFSFSLWPPLQGNGKMAFTLPLAKRYHYQPLRQGLRKLPMA